MVSLTRRSRLFRAFKPIVDGLKDKAIAQAEESEAMRFDREWFGGQWSRTHPYCAEPEIVESTGGFPLNTLGRAIDGVHRGEIVSVALVALGPDGVIHTAWSDGDLELMGIAASWLSGDLRKASKR